MKEESKLVYSSVIQFIKENLLLPKDGLLLLLLEDRGVALQMLLEKNELDT
jgi:hypothetical protein